MVGAGRKPLDLLWLSRFCWPPLTKQNMMAASSSLDWALRLCVGAYKQASLHVFRPSVHFLSHHTQFDILAE